MHRAPLRWILIPALLATSLLGACRTEPVDPGAGGPPGSPAARITGDQPTDRATLQRLGEEAAALARADGCSSADQCRSIAVGAKACGGPQYYLAYCPLTADVPALEAKARQIEAFERAFNARYGIVSTCSMVMPPRLEVSGGSCRAAAAPAPGA